MQVERVWSTDPYLRIREGETVSCAIVIKIEGVSDLREALKLKKDGYAFHIEKINFQAIDNELLSNVEKELWSELGQEAWANHGNINKEKKEILNA